MKIVDLCEFYSERGGGVRAYLGALSRAGAAAGHEVVIVAPGPRNETVHLPGGGRLVRYAGPRMPYDPSYHAPLRVDRMRAIVQREQPDVLQVSSPFVPSMVAATLRHVPVRAYVHHSDPIGCYISPIVARIPSHGVRDVLAAPAWSWMRALCRSCDVTVVAGDWLREQLKQQGCQRVVNVPFGIVHEDFSPQLRDAALRARLLGSSAAAPGAVLFLIAGRLAADKRQARLIDAVARVATERPLGLVVLGDGPERVRLTERARSIPNVTFLPFTRDRQEYAAILASADVLLHGSGSETYGFVIAETLASGTPVVVPDAGGARALVADDCGEAYPAHGAGADVVAAIARLLRRRTVELRQSARVRGAAQPAISDHFRALFQLYEDLLVAKRRRVRVAVTEPAA